MEYNSRNFVKLRKLRGMSALNSYIILNSGKYYAKKKKWSGANNCEFQPIQNYPNYSNYLSDLIDSLCITYNEHK